MAEKFTPDQVIEALRETQGMQFLAASRLRCHFNTIKNYIDRYPEIKLVVEQLRGERLDVAEDKLHAALVDGQPWAICFFLKTQGKHRGYVERSEVAHQGDKTSPVQVGIAVQQALAYEDTRELLGVLTRRLCGLTAPVVPGDPGPSGLSQSVAADPAPGPAQHEANGSSNGSH